LYTHLEQRDSTRPPVSLGTLERMKREREKIACITCYDASFAVLCDNADADLVLVGDSLGMVLQGHDTTVPVTMDDIVYHCRAVARGLNRPFLIADMPFMSNAKLRAPARTSLGSSGTPRGTSSAPRSSWRRTCSSRRDTCSGRRREPPARGSPAGASTRRQEGPEHVRMP